MRVPKISCMFDWNAIINKSTLKFMSKIFSINPQMIPNETERDARRRLDQYVEMTGVIYTSMTRIRAFNTSALSGSTMKSDIVSPVKAISGIVTVLVICKGQEHMTFKNYFLNQRIRKVGITGTLDACF